VKSLGLQRILQKGFVALGLALGLASAPLLAAKPRPSDTDLAHHIASNRSLLASPALTSARRLDAALESLAKLSDPAIARLVKPPEALTSTERLNGLLLQEIVSKIAARRGFEVANTDVDRARALEIFGELRREQGVKLDGKELVARLRTELQTDAEKTEILDLFDARIREQTKLLDDKLPELFASDAFRIADPTYHAFLKRLSIEYFTRLPIAEKQLLLMDIVEAAPRAKTAPSVGFDLLFRHAGPQYQKLLQIVAREEGLDPEFAKTLKRLESSVPETSFEKVEAFLRAEIPDVYPSKIRILSPKPLGSGTLAQTYSAVVIENGTERSVALRVLRPGVGARIREEKEIFEALTPLVESDPALRGTPFANFGMIWKRIAENVDEELQVSLTARNQKTFQDLYRARPHLKTASQGLSSDLRVPKVYFEELASHGVLVQEFVKGMSFERLGLENPSAARKAAIDFATLWMREALFLSGFHHSDPHQGNLRVADALSARPQVYLLDYGMVGSLSDLQRSDLILLGYALENHDAAKAAHHALQLMGEQGVSADPALVLRLAREEFEILEPSAPGLLERLVVAGQKLPRELVSFNRGYFMINQLLRQTDSPESLFEISSKMGRALVGQDIMSRVVGWGRIPKTTSNPTPLTPRQLWGVTGHEVKGACSRAVMRLLGR
jgi:predicted unusual protein kinase regulating ubiquinone biosynthesis (AarF/ABC1/UbiB family)